MPRLSSPRTCGIDRAAFLRALCLALVATVHAGCDGGDSRGVSTTTTSSTSDSTTITTTSTSTTTSAPTTTSSTSSTTVPGGECVGDDECFDFGIDCYCSFSTCHCSASQAELDLELVSDVPIGALQLEIGYESIGDSFVGSGGAVECVSLVTQSGTFSAFNDHEDLRRVSAAFINLTGIGGVGPLALMRCLLQVGGVLPTASDFTIVVTDASEIDLSPVDPPPVVRVSRIELAGGGFPLR
jgi:hypothetical protein